MRSDVGGDDGVEVRFDSDAGCGNLVLLVDGILYTDSWKSIEDEHPAISHPTATRRSPCCRGSVFFLGEKRSAEDTLV